jgi:hypothetical protein
MSWVNSSAGERADLLVDVAGEQTAGARIELPVAEGTCVQRKLEPRLAFAQVAIASGCDAVGILLLDKRQGPCPERELPVCALVPAGTARAAGTKTVAFRHDACHK